MKRRKIMSTFVMEYEITAGNQEKNFLKNV